MSTATCQPPFTVTDIGASNQGVIDTVNTLVNDITSQNSWVLAIVLVFIFITFAVQMVFIQRTRARIETLIQATQETNQTTDTDNEQTEN